MKPHIDYDRPGWDHAGYYRDNAHPDETKASFLASLGARHEAAVAKGDQMIADLPSASGFDWAGFYTELYTRLDLTPYLPAVLKELVARP